MELVINKESLRVFYGSDFHSDFWKYGTAPFFDRINPDNYDLFLFAGDVGEWEHGKGHAVTIYKEILARGKPIVMVPGNHEFYGGNYQIILSELEEFAAANPGFYLLNRDFLDLPVQEVRIWGDIFWTDFQGDERARHVARRRMNDYSKIYYSRNTGGVHLVPEDTVVLNDMAKRSLVKAAETIPDDWGFLVMTHHAPFPESTPKQYRKPEYSDIAKLNKAYANDLYEWCRDRVSPDVWIHGHIHDRAHYEVDIDDHICTVVSNPFGYPGEKNHDDINKYPMTITNRRILLV